MSVRQLAVVLFLTLALAAGAGSAMLLDNNAVRFTSAGNGQAITSQTYTVRGVIHRYSTEVRASITITDGGRYVQTADLPLVDMGDHYAFNYLWSGYADGDYQVVVRVLPVGGRQAGTVIATQSMPLKVSLRNAAGH